MVGRRQPITCGEAIATDVCNGGVRRKPSARARAAHCACRSASGSGTDSRSRWRACRPWRTVAGNCASKPASHNSPSTSGQWVLPPGVADGACMTGAGCAWLRDADGVVVTCFCTMTGVVAGSAATRSMAADDSSGNCSGACQTSPTSNCAPTSHHNVQRIAAERRGSRRTSRASRAISTTACSEVQPSRLSSDSAICSMLMSGLLAPRLQLRHQRL
ncbi:hypothetical protein RLIN73S_01974 [Rhodanobacter lindaniclasticus]